MVSLSTSANSMIIDHTSANHKAHQEYWLIPEFLVIKHDNQVRSDWNGLRNNAISSSEIWAKPCIWDMREGKAIWGFETKSVNNPVQDNCLIRIDPNGQLSWQCLLIQPLTCVARPKSEAVHNDDEWITKLRWEEILLRKIAQWLIQWKPKLSWLFNTEIRYERN
jgi:hypothetical protein